MCIIIHHESLCVNINQAGLVIPQLLDKKVDPAGMFQKLYQAHAEKFMGTMGCRFDQLFKNYFISCR